MCTPIRVQAPDIQDGHVLYFGSLRNPVPIESSDSSSSDSGDSGREPEPQEPKNAALAHLRIRRQMAKVVIVEVRQP